MDGIFDRVVCGVDQSGAGETAARVAARLTAPDGELTLVTVEDPSIALRAGWRGTALAGELREEAEHALASGLEQATPEHAAGTRLLQGDPVHALLAELRRRRATLAVVGTHGLARAVGLALGSVATQLLHEAPCSVLIARAPRDERWPRSIVVGVDGSAESAAALAAARDLAERFGAALRPVVAAGESEVDLVEAFRGTPDLEKLHGKAVAELRTLSADADLLVLGSRGLKGLRSLGSVGERVAHGARCSVLVVRPNRFDNQEEEAR